MNPSVWFIRGGSPRARIPRPYHYCLIIIDKRYVYVVFDLCAGGDMFRPSTVHRFIPWHWARISTHKKGKNAHNDGQGDA